MNFVAMLNAILAEIKTDPVKALAMMRGLLGALALFPQALGVFARMLPAGPLQDQLVAKPSEAIVTFTATVEAFQNNPELFVAVFAQYGAGVTARASRAQSNGALASDEETLRLLRAGRLVAKKTMAALTATKARTRKAKKAA